MTETTLAQDLKELKKLRDKRDALADKKTLAEKKFSAAQRAVMDRMELEGEVTSLKVGNVSFTKVATTYADIVDKEAFTKWAKENDEDLLTEQPAKALVRTAFLQMLEDGEDISETGLMPRVQEYVRIS